MINEKAGKESWKLFGDKKITYHDEGENSAAVQEQLAEDAWNT